MTCDPRSPGSARTGHRFVRERPTVVGPSRRARGSQTDGPGRKPTSTRRTAENLAAVLRALGETLRL